MRPLGGYLFAQEEYADAAQSLRQTVMINPLHLRPISSLVVGVFTWKIGTVRARRSRVASLLNEEDAEGWNNLASVYLRIKYVPGKNLSQSEVRPALGSQLFIRPRTVTVTTSKSLSRRPTG